MKKEKFDKANEIDQKIRILKRISKFDRIKLYEDTVDLFFGFFQEKLTIKVKELIKNEILLLEQEFEKL